MKFLRFIREALIVAAPLLVALVIVETLVFAIPIHDPGVAFLIGMAGGAPGMLGSMALWMERH